MHVFQLALAGGDTVELESSISLHSRHRCLDSRGLTYCTGACPRNLQLTDRTMGDSHVTCNGTSYQDRGTSVMTCSSVSMECQLCIVIVILWGGVLCSRAFSAS